MKKKLLVIFFLSSISFQLFAQAPTLRESNSSPIIGDTYINQGVFSGTAPMYTGGAGQSWDYSGLIDSGSVTAFQVVAPSSTPYADSFPGSNLSIKSAGDSVFSYFTTSASNLVINGVITNNGTTVKYDPFRVYLPYPFTFNSTYNGSVTAHISGIKYTPSGTDSVLADGYGTLQIPGKTFSNALRVRYIENLVTTFDSGFYTVTIHSRTVSYLYLIPDYHVPVLSDAVTETTTTFSIGGFPLRSQTNTSRSINYLKTFVLPVTFQQFKATLQNKDVNLSWNTGQEINTGHFIIQRSLTGRDFQSVATIPAKGSSQGAAYMYSDKTFAGTSIPAIVYYRIQSADKDGKTLLSEVAVVKGNDALTISVYPNPASSYIRVANSDGTLADILIYDAKGSLVKQWHNYAVSQPLNISSLAKGNYRIMVTVAGNKTTATVIKN